MQQIAVCGMNFEHLKPDTIGALSGIGKSSDDIRNLLRRHRRW